MDLLFYNSILAVLITGGYDGGTLNTAELFLPSDGTSCALPSLPQIRRYHTVDNNILCGGYGTEDSCLQWSPDTGTWEELTILTIRRSSHVSWSPASGIGTYLIGGGGSKTTTTLLTPVGGQQTGFLLKYATE